MQKLLEALAGTAEVMGQQISPIALSVMADDLKDYDVELVLRALAQVRRENKGRLSIASIIEKIELLNPDGRPSPNEAWAMIPHDESASVVMTEEMAKAMGIALPLLIEGDKIGARMAFIEAYKRIVESNKQNGVKVKWFPSLGTDVGQRETAMMEAVKIGRISPEHAIGLLPPDRVFPMLQGAGKNDLALEYKPADDKTIKERINALKEVLTKNANQ